MTNDRQRAELARDPEATGGETLSTAAIAGTGLSPADAATDENQVWPPRGEAPGGEAPRGEAPGTDPAAGDVRAERAAPEAAATGVSAGPETAGTSSEREAPRAPAEPAAGSREAAAVETSAGRVPAQEPSREPDAADDSQEASPLFGEDATARYRQRWSAVQTDFVDDPRRAVQQADELVAELMQALAQTFSDERARLEGQWDTGGEASTEDLRVALRRYRSFFSRLLTF